MKPLSILLLLTPSAALAHAGDHSATGPAHALTSADHLVMIGLGLALTAWLLVRRRATVGAKAKQRVRA